MRPQDGKRAAPHRAPDRPKRRTAVLIHREPTVRDNAQYPESASKTQIIPMTELYFRLNRIDPRPTNPHPIPYRKMISAEINCS